MTIIRIAKEFRFEAAHMLKDYDGLCANNHGHSYKLIVTIAGQISEDKSSPKLGMLIDFGDLKKIVFEEIIDKYDHALVVNSEVPIETKEKMTEITSRIIFTPFQPTCENLIADFASKIRSRLPAPIVLFSLRLHETSSSFAEWFASDNPI